MQHGARATARPFSEKAWNRRALIPWDERWHALSTPARHLFLDVIEPRPPQNGVLLDLSPRSSQWPVLKELEDAGFVVVSPNLNSALGRRVAPSPKARDFTLRMRAIKKYRLLQSQEPAELVSYVQSAYYRVEAEERLGEVLRKARMEPADSLDQIVARWVTRRYWPDWAAALVKSPLKDPLLKVIRHAAGPLSLAGLAAKLPAAKPEDVRAAVDEMVAYLILFEDLQPETLELAVDFLPAVRSDLAAGAQRPVRPPLVVCEQVEELSLDGGTIVPDLRALLLEAAVQPPRLTQGGEFFAKEAPRFKEILELQPGWLPKDFATEYDNRLGAAVALARRLGLVIPSSEQGELRMHVTAAGQHWLAGGLTTQYVSVFESYNRRAAVHLNTAHYGAPDYGFLGTGIAATTPDSTRQPVAFRYMRVSATEADVLALRAALLRAFEALPLGVYHRLDSVLAHFSFDANSPFNLGRPPGSVVLHSDSGLVPNVKEEREQACRRALDRFIRDRLVPLGALRAALEPGKVLCVARTPLLTAYFGQPGLELDQPAATPGETRVVVQPDFSIIVIGLNPAPAAALAPFCERAPGAGGSGALVFKLTRASVLKAVGLGLSGGEILARLRQHASNALPANVERQLNDWCGWVRTVAVSTLTVLRCGDRAAADRTLAALGKRAERLTDTIIGLTDDRLTSADRAKLQGEGILIGGRIEGSTKKKTRRKKKRRDDDW